MYIRAIAMTSAITTTTNNNNRFNNWKVCNWKIPI